MIARLLAALVLLAATMPLVAGVASPAAACSCVTADPARQAADATVAFSGVVLRGFATDELEVHRVRVSEVFAGEVHRTQDVVKPRDDTCGDVGLEEGAAVLVLAGVDEEGRVAVNGCAPARVEGTAAHTAALDALGKAGEPLAGRDLVEREGWFRRDLLWVKLVVGLVGLAALGLIAARWLGSRRDTA